MIEPLGDRLALRLEATRLVEEPDDERRPLVERQQDLVGDAVDRPGGTGSAGTSGALDEQVFGGVATLENGVVDVEHLEIADGRERVDLVRQVVIGGFDQRLGQGVTMAALAESSDRLTPLGGKMKRVEDRFGLSFDRSGSEQHVAAWRRQQHRRSGQGEQSCDVNRKTEEPGRRTTIERRLLAAGTKLPPLAQFAGCGHVRSPRTVPEECCARGAAVCRPIAIFGCGFGLSNRVTPSKNPVAGGRFRLQWRYLRARGSFFPAG